VQNFKRTGKVRQGLTKFDKARLAMAGRGWPWPLYAPGRFTHLAGIFWPENLAGKICQKILLDCEIDASKINFLLKMPDFEIDLRFKTLPNNWLHFQSSVLFSM